jgi:hypothetical protein
MPDPIAIFWAMAAAGAVTALVLLLGSRLGNGTASAVGWPLAVGLGFVTGAAMLSFRPRGVLATDQERFVLLVVPLAVAVESWIAIRPRSVAQMAMARGVVALSCGPLLLLGSVYLTGGGGGWSPAERVFFLLGLGMLILGPWLALATLQQRRPDSTILLALAATSLAAGVTTMLSGYASAGQLALPLAATLAVAAAVVVLLAASPRASGAVGVGWICLAGVLFIGRFFGSLTTLHGVLLGATPLISWLGECRPLCVWPTWPRRLLPLTLALLLLGLVVWQAQQRFQMHSGSPVPGAAPAPSMQDYLDFGR